MFLLYFLNIINLNSILDLFSIQNLYVLVIKKYEL